MSDKAAEPQSIAHWPTLRQAIQRIVAVRGLDINHARQMLLDGLRSGMLTGYVSRRATKEVFAEPVQHTSPMRINPSRWASMHYEVYDTGTHSFESSEPGRNMQVWWFDIRVRPDELDENFPIAKPPPPAPTPADDDNEPDSTKPPVSDAHLHEWYALYEKVYPGSSEDAAWRSAKGMFPGKFVARDRVRTLRGAQKRGRKPKDA